VGNKAKIKSISLSIEGQTHKNSVIESVSAKINKHKGKLKAKHVFIKSLEGGEVRAKKVKVKNALGGSIYAHEVEIENLLSHTKIYALNKIVIKNLKGEENLLAIAPKRILDTQNIDEMLNKVKEIEQNINILKREIKKKKEIIEKNHAAYEELKNIYIANKNSNKRTNPSVLMKLKEHKILRDNYQKLLQKLKNYENDKQELLEIIDNIQNAVYNAKIISLTPWKAFNRIEFDILEPPVSLKYDTKGDEGICGFKLKFFGETPKIVKIKVKDDSSS
jgi:Mg2+ and Co2+ transporter CorA